MSCTIFIKYLVLLLFGMYFQFACCCLSLVRMTPTVPFRLCHFCS